MAPLQLDLSLDATPSDKAIPAPPPPPPPPHPPTRLQPSHGKDLG